MMAERGSRSSVRNSGLLRDGASHLSELFELCDVAHRGYLLLDGFHRLWRELAFPITAQHNQHVARTFALLDTDGDGRIDCKDFLDGLETMLTEVNSLVAAEGERSWEDRLESSFAAHDPDRRGYVDAATVDDVLQDAGIVDVGERGQIVSALQRKGGIVRVKSLISMVYLLLLLLLPKPQRFQTSTVI